MEKEISCGFVLYTKSPEILFLLLKHPNQGEWEFPKGHQENSETYYETAKRELIEEVNLDADKDITLAKKNEQLKSFTYEYRSPSGSLRKMVLFVGLCNKNPIISSEHRGFAWFTFEEAKKLLKYPEVRGCLEEIYHFVRIDSL
ncbi:MAG TPA: NUDIX domain-containing protein [Candidatus Nanoarchaeia archaeon]|nr:NUDIX domain-containing protein [Candidatus Nanoarchaeia archaeon]